MKAPTPRRAAKRSTKRGPTYLSPHQLEVLTSAVLGEYGWKGRLAKLTGMRRSSISRYLSGDNAIPKWLAVLVFILRHAPPDELQKLIDAVPLDEVIQDENAVGRPSGGSTGNR